MFVSAQPLVVYIFSLTLLALCSASEDVYVRDAPLLLQRSFDLGLNWGPTKEFGFTSGADGVKEARYRVELDERETQALAYQLKKNGLYYIRAYATNRYTESGYLIVKIPVCELVANDMTENLKVTYSATGEALALFNDVVSDGCNLASAPNDLSSFTSVITREDGTEPPAIRLARSFNEDGSRAAGDELIDSSAQEEAAKEKGFIQRWGVYLLPALIVLFMSAMKAPPQQPPAGQTPPGAAPAAGTAVVSGASAGQASAKATRRNRRRE